MQKQRAKELAKCNRLSLEKLFEKMKLGEVKDLNLIIKADVHGSIEAIEAALSRLSNNEVKIKIIHAGTGAIAETDVYLADVSNAIIIGFNVRPNTQAQALAAKEHVDIRFYDIIYNLTEDIQKAILGMMASKFEERVLGRAEVKKVIAFSKLGFIAGCHVVSGKIQRNANARLIRDGVSLRNSKISSLKRFKDDVKEVLIGYECGIGLEDSSNIKENDIIECYYVEEIKPAIQQEKEENK